jgi:hypothetical protein
MHVREIDAMMREGVPFEHIEAHIEELALPPDVKSVLWLWAWVDSDAQDRRRVVEEMYEALTAR